MTTKWTVKPFCTPREDSDPLGVFEIKEVKAEAEKWEDASMDAAPGSDEEQHAIDRKGEVTEQAARLIAAAPELLDALKLLFEDWVTLVGDDREDNEDVRCIWQACQDALTKATGKPVMAA
jgi:hypothetical protein